MSNQKYTKEGLEALAKRATQDGARSLRDIARESGIDERSFRRNGVDIDALFLGMGVGRLLRGTPRRSQEDLRQALLSFVQQEKRWIPQEEMAAHVGLTGMGLRAYDLDTNELCASAGYSKPNNKGSRDRKSSLDQCDAARIDYVNFIREAGRVVRLREFCESTGHSYDSLRHHKVSPRQAHEEAGVEYDRWVKKYSLEEVDRQCREYILEQQRYVTAMELQDVLGFSRSTIFKAVGSLAELNAELGFYSDNYGFERQVRAALTETFPGEEIVPQKKFDDLISPKGRRLRYDFYLPRLNLLVEADGDQHYVEEAKWYTESLFERDRLKDRYAEENGIHLIRIRYRCNFRSKDLVTVLRESGVVLHTAA